MKYQHRFRVRAPLERVAGFHRDSASLGAITPPPVAVQVERAPDLLTEGDEMAFTLCLGPLSIPWLARIENVVPTGFIDRQLQGPFRSWVHRHVFVPLDEATTMVVDEVEAKLRLHPLWGPVGLGMWLSLPLLFAYRGWKTKNLLEQ